MDVVQRFKEVFGEPIEEELKKFTETYLAVSARGDFGLINLPICLKKHKKNMTEFEKKMIMVRPKKTDGKRKTLVRNDIFIDLQRLLDILDFFNENTFEASFFRDELNNKALIIKITEDYGVVIAEKRWIEENTYFKREYEEKMKKENVIETPNEDYYSWDYAFSSINITDDMEF